jgi:hypothetical protein
LEIVGERPEREVVCEVVRAFPTDWNRVSFWTGTPGPFTILRSLLSHAIKYFSLKKP